MNKTVWMGVDPGPTNTGIALVTPEKFLSSQVINITQKTITETVIDLLKTIDPTTLAGVCCERFVPYKDTPNKHSERINLFLGALAGSLSNVTSVYAVRALDWKIKLGQYQTIKQGFDNPSQTHDKKFSLALARSIYPELNEIKKLTDHEADATCLGFTGYLLSQNLNLKHVIL